jgi:hypothetical protein
MLRQQAEKENNYLSQQADFIAPKGYKDDHMGMIAVSCFRCDVLVVARYETELSVRIERI